MGNSASQYGQPIFKSPPDLPSYASQPTFDDAQRDIVALVDEDLDALIARLVADAEQAEARRIVLQVAQYERKRRIEAAQIRAVIAGE